MTVQELIAELIGMPEDAEILVDVEGEVRDICRITDDSQGVYLVVDQFATDRKNWYSR
jgi:hypothetical protein